jgi:hypothetical protein
MDAENKTRVRELCEVLNRDVKKTICDRVHFTSQRYYALQIW